MLDNPNFVRTPLSPQSALNIAKGDPCQLSQTLLINIICCLAATVKQCKEAHKQAINSFDKMLQSLQDKVLHYKETFSTPSAGYVKNNGHYPDLQVCMAGEIFWPAKWAWQMDNLQVTTLCNSDVGFSTPSIVEVYATPNHSEQPVQPWPD